jgi:hypothetical protein
MTGDRLTEPELLQRWQGARPRILAGLLDGVCCVLRNVDGVTLPEGMAARRACAHRRESSSQARGAAAPELA